MPTAQTHKLGFGNGSITDNGDGTASYRRPAEFTAAFRVRIADVTGFSVAKSVNGPDRTMKVQGGGTELASVRIHSVAAARIEAWFRAHPDFGTGVAPTPSPSSAPAALDGRLVADELAKLAGLRDAGVLTEDEFAAQKAKLLS